MNDIKKLAIIRKEYGDYFFLEKFFCMVGKSW